MLPSWIKIGSKIWFMGLGEVSRVIYIDDNHIDDIDCYWVSLLDDGQIVISTFDEVDFWCNEHIDYR